MAMKLRILFTVLAAICIAALVPVGAIVSWTAAIFCALGAFLFFGLMLLCKQKTDASDPAEPKESSQADFFHPATDAKSADDQTEEK